MLHPVVTCEHGGHEVPEELGALFAGLEELLSSHRGWDPGALELARDLAARLGAPLVTSTVSRLVVDLNRSLAHRALFSAPIRSLPRPERQRIVSTWYLPYRARVERAVAGVVAAGETALHLSVHSFTPVLSGRTRQADVAFLYDPRRPGEAPFCRRLKELLGRRRPELRVRFNQPYRGTADGLTTALRRRFPGTAYLGIELEVNQRFPLAGAEVWGALRSQLVAVVAEAAGL